MEELALYFLKYYAPAVLHTPYIQSILRQNIDYVETLFHHLADVPTPLARAALYEIAPYLDDRAFIAIVRTYATKPIRDILAERFDFNAGNFDLLLALSHRGQHIKTRRAAIVRLARQFDYVETNLLDNKAFRKTFIGIFAEGSARLGHVAIDYLEEWLQDKHLGRELGISAMIGETHQIDSKYIDSSWVQDDTYPLRFRVSVLQRVEGEYDLAEKLLRASPATSLCNMLAKYLEKSPSHLERIVSDTTLSYRVRLSALNFLPNPLEFVLSSRSLSVVLLRHALTLDTNMLQVVTCAEKYSNDDKAVRAASVAIGKREYYDGMSFLLSFPSLESADSLCKLNQTFLAAVMCEELITHESVKRKAEIAALLVDCSADKEAALYKLIALCEYEKSGQIMSRIKSLARPDLTEILIMHFSEEDDVPF